MSAPLYNTEILRLAASIPHQQRLDAPQGSVERRSPVCGSRVAADVILGPEGSVAELGLAVNACALGQASASLMSRHALGRSLAELQDARDALTAFLDGRREDPGAWPGLQIFAEARKHTARHASIRLPFEAVTEAVERALS